MRFLIRADASVKTGSGHVMRTLGLAQGLRDAGHDVCFLHVCPDRLRDRLRSDGFQSLRLDAVPGSPEDAAATTGRADRFGDDWVVADGYSFSSEFQRSVQQADARLLLVDDNGDADGYPADIVLNQSLHADPSLYGEWFDQERFLLGSNYVLLRDEFRSRIGYRRAVAPTPTRLLVSLGGLPDPAWLARLFPELSALRLEVTVTGGDPASTLSDIGWTGSIRVLHEVDDMADLITRSDVGLAAGGGTAKEFMFLGLPFAVVDVADNQTLQSQFLGDRNLARWLGPIETLAARELIDGIESLVVNRSERMRMSSAGQTLVDGHGVQRVVARLTA